MPDTPLRLARQVSTEGSTSGRRASWFRVHGVERTAAFRRRNDCWARCTILKSIPQEELGTLLEWISASLQMYPEREQRVLLSSLLLEHLLRVSSIRDAFSCRHDDLKMLATVLIRSRNVQIQYQAIFAIWLLTFDASTALTMVTRYGVIQSLLDVAKGAIKEKIIRMCISTWRNLLSKCPAQAVPVMVGAKVLEYLESIAEGKIADEEVSLDVSVLKDELLRAYQSLNSFDEYTSELKSGKLEWSPPHKSELFWRDNASRLAENDLELLKVLGKLLEPSNNPQVLAIAAGDIGMYVSFHAVGRQNLDKIGIKQKVMSLISHPDSEVRFQALSSMQKYMVKVWNPA